MTDQPTLSSFIDLADIALERFRPGVRVEMIISVKQVDAGDPPSVIRRRSFRIPPCMLFLHHSVHVVNSSPLGAFADAEFVFSGGMPHDNGALEFVPVRNARLLRQRPVVGVVQRQGGGKQDSTTPGPFRLPGGACSPQPMMH